MPLVGEQWASHERLVHALRARLDADRVAARAPDRTNHEQRLFRTNAAILGKDDEPLHLHGMQSSVRHG